MRALSFAWRWRSSSSSTRNELMDAPRARHRALTFWSIAMTLSVVAHLSCHALPLSPGDNATYWLSVHRWAALPARVAFALLLGSPIPLALAVLDGLRRTSTQAFWVRVGVLSVGLWAVFIVGRIAVWPLTERALQRTAANAAPLISALNSRVSRDGSAPPDLAGFSVPATGMRAYPDFRYRPLGQKEQRSAWLYDLGARSGRSMVSDWRTTLGDMSHSVLVVRVDGAGSVHDCFIDRPPVRAGTEPFEAERFRAKPAERLAMGLGIESQCSRIHTGEQVRQVFGAPESVTPEIHAVYELRAASSPSGLERGRFFYWPKESYPQQLDGALLRRVGGWAYEER